MHVAVRTWQWLMHTYTSCTNIQGSSISTMCSYKRVIHQQLITLCMIEQEVAMLSFIRISAVLLIPAVLVSTCSAQFDFTFSESTMNRTEDISIALPPPTADLQFYALPVGQGDCTIIQCPNGNTVVLDCGSSGGNRMTPNQVENFLGTQINQVVAIIITHPDRDHFNYLYQIDWNDTSINQVIIGGTLQNYDRPSSQFMMIYNWLLNFNNMGKLYTVSNGQSCIGNCAVTLGTNFCDNQNIQFNILAANVGSTSNQKSIVMKSVVGQFSMLLPGDMEGTAANTIATTLGQQLQSVVYKIAHHGASTIANSPTWLAPIQPRSAFASSAYNFGNCRHPRCLTIQRILNSQTIIQTTLSHDFYCGNGPGVNPTQYNDYNESIFETSPTLNSICLVTYLSSLQGSYNCFQLFQVSDGVGDDECPQPEDLEEEEGGNGARIPVVASSLIAIVTLINFIV